MKHPGSKETADEKAAGVPADKTEGADKAESAGNTESPANSSNSEAPSEIPGDMTPQPWPNTAIERQIATVSARRSRKRAHQEAESPISARRKTNFHTRRRKPHRVGLATFLVFFLFVAAGLAWVFTDPDRPMQKAIYTVWQRVWPTAATPNPAPVAATQTPVPKVAEVSAPAELAIPIADVSLRSRPELLAQLVQVYRSQLADDPNDSAALTALNQLQERSLSELETMIAEGGGDATAGNSLQIISRLFPELADNSRYKYVAARIDSTDRQATDELADKPESSTPLATTISPDKTVSAPLDPAAMIAKKADKKIASPSKPEIRAVSIIPGKMVEDRFIPSDDGNVLMVGINYRNFDKISADQSEVTLVTRLGIPGDSTVLAEVPVVIAGDRGSKSFLIETLMPGHTGEKYQLNFLLNGEFLLSRVVRLSMPGQ